MFILADTIFLVFYLAPHLVKKMQLVDFCARILHNNHTNDHVVLSANIHVMLLDVFSKYQHADDKIQNEPTVITFLCQTLLSENTACLYKRRTVGGFPIYYVPDRKKERNQEPGGRGPPSVPPRSTWYKFLEGGPLPPGS